MCADFVGLNFSYILGLQFGRSMYIMFLWFFMYNLLIQTIYGFY